MRSPKDFFFFLECRSRVMIIHNVREIIWLGSREDFQMKVAMKRRERPADTHVMMTNEKRDMGMEKGYCRRKGHEQTMTRLQKIDSRRKRGPRPTRSSREAIAAREKESLTETDRTSR